MAAHRWVTEPTETLPSRLLTHRREPPDRPGPASPPGLAVGTLDAPNAFSADAPDSAGIPGTGEPAGPPAAFPRRWRFPRRAAILAACLVLAAAIALPFARIQAPSETIAVELGTDAENAGAAEGGTAVPHAAALERPAEQEPPADGAVPGTTAAPSPPPGPDRAVAPGSVLVVHVAGAVARPGIVHIEPGGRVADAVAAAGGATPEADLTLVNLAAPMEDGSMVVVPAAGAEAAGPAGLPVSGNPPGTGAGTSAGATGGQGAAAGPGTGSVAAAGQVNLNTASDAELQTLPRVGPVLSARIVAWRTEHGRFSRPEDLDAVPGIGEAMLAALLPLVTV